MRFKIGNCFINWEAECLLLQADVNPVYQQQGGWWLFFALYFRVVAFGKFTDRAGFKSACFLPSGMSHRFSPQKMKRTGTLVQRLFNTTQIPPLSKPYLDLDSRMYLLEGLISAVRSRLKRCNIRKRSVIQGESSFLCLIAVGMIDGCMECHARARTGLWEDNKCRIDWFHSLPW